MMMSRSVVALMTLLSLVVQTGNAHRSESVDAELEFDQQLEDADAKQQLDKEVAANGYGNGYGSALSAEEVEQIKTQRANRKSEEEQIRESQAQKELEEEPVTDTRPSRCEAGNDECVFQKMDTDGNGDISFTEVKSYFSAQLDGSSYLDPGTLILVRCLFNAFKNNLQGQFGLSEFKTWLQQQLVDLVAAYDRYSECHARLEGSTYERVRDAVYEKEEIEIEVANSGMTVNKILEAPGFAEEFKANLPDRLQQQLDTLGVELTGFSFKDVTFFIKKQLEAALPEGSFRTISASTQSALFTAWGAVRRLDVVGGDDRVELKNADRALNKFAEVFLGR